VLQALSLRVLAQDLWFPEGPVVMPDGSLMVVEIRRQTLTRVRPDGTAQIVAHLGGGPNGAALGPDGCVYVCNNGGFSWAAGSATHIPTGTAQDYRCGRIERVNPVTGLHSVLFDRVGDHPLRGPNDLVFDAHGGFWFTDHGKRRPRDMDFGGLYYAKADGSSIHEVVFPLLTPNGVGLSPDGTTLYVAETMTARVWAWDVVEPGRLRVDASKRSGGGRLLHASSKPVRFDSMALEANGNLCLGTLDGGCITVLSPDGELLEERTLPDPWVTNLCFGGPGHQTAFVTLSTTGMLASCQWPRPGLALNGAPTIHDQETR
jgi:gluconolactonase